MVVVIRGGRGGGAGRGVVEMRRCTREKAEELSIKATSLRLELPMQIGTASNTNCLPSPVVLLNGLCC